LAAGASDAAADGRRFEAVAVLEKAK